MPDDVVIWLSVLLCSWLGVMNAIQVVNVRVII